MEDKGAKIYLDFGESFNFGEDYFYEYLAPRTANGLEVLFEFDLISNYLCISEELVFALLILGLPSVLPLNSRLPESKPKIK